VCYQTGHRRAFLDELFFDDGSKQFIVNDSNFLDKLRLHEQVKPFTNPYIEQIEP
jgi:alpha-D-ribose 1-methylphosphonate 5-phosphate C-P lyase